MMSIKNFTPKGYQKWGKMLYEFLLPWITQIYKQKFAKNNDK